MRIIAKIETKTGWVVKGRKLEGIRKLGKPEEFAYKYYETGVDEIIFLDSVASLYGRGTLDEVIEKANNTPYGLSAGVWTEKGSKIFKLTKALNTGVVWANTYNKFDPASPFGGVKESGYGREGGLHGLKAYLNLV